MLLAIPKAQSLRRDFVQLNVCLRVENPVEVLAMEEGLAAWENDHSCPDPYRVPKSSKSHVTVTYQYTNIPSDITLQQVRLLIAEEEKARAEAGSSVTHDVTAGAFLLLGMDIQNLQYVFSRSTTFALIMFL